MSRVVVVLARLGVALLCVSGCRSRPYPVHADLDTSVPNILRVNVSTVDEGTVTLMGTSAEARMGKTSLAINMSQIPPGPHFLRVSFTPSYDQRRGSTIVEFNRPIVAPTLGVGSHESKREPMKCGGDVCVGDVEAPMNGMMKIPVDAPPGCVVEVLGKSTTMPIRYVRFTSEREEYASLSSSPPEPSALWVEVKGLEKKAPPLSIKARVTCDEQAADFDFTLTRQ